MKFVSDWVGLKALWEEMCLPDSGIYWATHQHIMIKTDHSYVVWSEQVDWLLIQRKVTCRGQGIQIGQLLIDSGLLECVPLCSVHEDPHLRRNEKNSDFS